MKIIDRSINNSNPDEWRIDVNRLYESQDVTGKLFLNGRDSKRSVGNISNKLSKKITDFISKWLSYAKRVSWQSLDVMKRVVV